MRVETPKKLEQGRVLDGPFASDPAWGPHGAFFVLGPCGQELKIIASDGSDPEAMFWEHVSVSLRNRCPNWQEMSFVKDLFWGEDETVVQFHPRKSEYVNQHPFCLHLWKPSSDEFILPPLELIGTKTVEAA